MKRIFKILRLSLLLLLLVLSASIAVLYYRQDQISAYLLENLNHHLRAPIAVQKVGISLQRFPSAALRLQKVYSPGTFHKNDTLLQAESVFMEFDLWSVFSQNIKVKRISFEKGQIFLRFDEKGNGNYEIWEPQPKDSPTDSSIFDLEELAIQQMGLRVEHLELEINMRAYIENLLLGGRISAQSQKLKGRIKGQMLHFALAEESYLKQRLDLHSSLRWESRGEAWQLKSDDLRINQLSALQLSLRQEPNAPLLSMLEGQDLPLDQWLASLREYQLLENDDWQLEGVGSLQMRLSQTSGEPMLTEVDFSAYNMRLQNSEAQLKKLWLQGRYRQKGSEQSLYLDSLRSDELDLWSHGSLHNFEHPELKLRLHAALSLAQWKIFLPLDSLYRTEGQARAEIHFAGKFDNWEQIKSSELARARVSGSLHLQDCAFGWGQKGSRFEALQGQMQLADQRLNIEQLRFRRGKSDIELKGYFAQFLPSLLLENEKLIIRGQLIANHLQVGDFLVEDQTNSDKMPQLILPPLLDLQLGFAVEHLAFENFSGRELKGNLRIVDRVLQVSKLSLLADGGSYRGNFSLHAPENASSYPLQADLAVENLDLASVFYSFQNFGQNTLTAEHLSGRITAQARFNIGISPSLDPDPQSLHLEAHLHIDQGVLQKFEPMLALSHFAEIDELREVRFETLENDLSIHSGVIAIPNMTIQSNVLEMQLAGQHDFDNNIDYIIQLKLGDILFKKRQARRGKSEFDEHLAVNKRDDDHRIPIALKGSVDHPQLSINRSALSRSLGDDIRKQKEELKSIFKKDTTRKANNGGLIFEWDEG